jgi:NAD(P)-dependent dehydrogenase (short-subunit alcohol dehydrogenase family)
MDVTNESQIENAKREIAQQAANIDLLINVAGILRVDTSIKTIKYEDVLESYKTNTIGPLLVAKHFYDLLQKKKLSGDESFEQAAMSVLANISAKAGSIGENTVGGWTSQRSTKAALNMITKNEALEFRSRGIVCVSLDPGVVETEMSAPYRKALPKTISADDASSMLLKLIFNLKQQDTGKFFSYDGTELKW